VDGCGVTTVGVVDDLPRRPKVIACRPSVGNGCDFGLVENTWVHSDRVERNVGRLTRRDCKTKKEGVRACVSVCDCGGSRAARQAVRCERE
jgi:hypothetical protein